MIGVELRFQGSASDDGLLDFYDAARALAGFQRSLALTTHLVLNGEIITQAPALSGAQILIPAMEQGSWKSKAWIAIGATFTLGSVGKDSPVGQIVTSVYDYALSETMGFHVDYEKTLQQQYHEHLEGKKITAEKIDSLVEKIEPSVADMHRPIVISGTATRADLRSGFNKLGPDLSMLTYDYVKQSIVSDSEDEFIGYVSSYNINTFKGRIFCVSEGRPIPFELSYEARLTSIVGLLTRSQHLNGQKRFDPSAAVKIKAFKLTSSSGRLKRLYVTSVQSAEPLI